MQDLNPYAPLQLICHTLNYPSPRRPMSCPIFECPPNLFLILVKALIHVQEFGIYFFAYL